MWGFLRRGCVSWNERINGMIVRAFIFSTLVHVSIIAGLMYMNGDVDISFDINKGISSLSIATKNKPEREKVAFRGKGEA